MLSEKVTAALYVPNFGIICPYELTVAAVGNAIDNGVELIRNFEVADVKKENGVFTVTSVGDCAVQAKYFVNCADCYSDKIAALTGESLHYNPARRPVYAA